MKVIRVIAILLSITVLAGGGVLFFYGNMKESLSGAVPEKIEQEDVEAPAAPVPPAESEEVEIDYQVIVTRNIFKAEEDSGSGAVEEAIDEEELEETTLQLALLGTVTGTEQDARAIIIDKKERKQDLYRIGDLIQNAKIRKILRGKVVLEVNGRNEILLIKDREGGGPKAALSRVAEPVRSPVIEREVREQVQVVRPRRRLSLRQPRQVVPVEEPEDLLKEEVEPDTEQDLQETAVQELEEEAQDVEAPETTY